MPQMKGMYRKANLRNILPEELNQQLIEGIHGFSRQITGFDQADAVLSGVESRTSSPVRIERDAAFQSVNLAGLYPCGEGAGYAGGIQVRRWTDCGYLRRLPQGMLRLAADKKGQKWITEKN